MSLLFLYKFGIKTIFTLLAIYLLNLNEIVCSDISQLSKTFPAVDMVFGNGEKLSLSPENYMFRVR